MSIKPWKQTLVLFDGGLSRGSLFREPGWPVEGKIAEKHELRSASISLAITWEWEYLKWSSICSHCGLQIAWAARWDSNILATLAPNGFSSAPLKPAPLCSHMAQVRTTPAAQISKRRRRRRRRSAAPFHVSSAINAENTTFVFTSLDENIFFFHLARRKVCRLIRLWWKFIRRPRVSLLTSWQTWRNWVF